MEISQVSPHPQFPLLMFSTTTQIGVSSDQWHLLLLSPTLSSNWCPQVGGASLIQKICSTHLWGRFQLSFYPRSEYPEEPIENPAEWAWGQHPRWMQIKTFSPLNIFRNGLGYKAKDNLELEVCLANPHMIATAKCKIPLDLCLENPEWLPLVGCSGEGYPRQVCLDFPNLITSPACEGQNCTPCSSCLCPPLPLPFPLAFLFLTLTNTFSTSSPQRLWSLFFGNLPQISLSSP